MGNKIQKIYVGQDLVRPQENWVYTKYEFPSGTYPGWTVKSGSFAQGSLGSGWITAGSGSTNCTMYMNIATWSKFKIQHRCWANPLSRGGAMGLYIRPSADGNITGANYNVTTASGYKGYTRARINGTTYTDGQFYVTQGYYIDEIVYDGTSFTVSIYQDNSGEPGTLLYSCTAQTQNTNTRMELYHEHATTPYSQTNRVKVRHT